MNWGVYKQILDEKVSDAWYNWEEAEKKARQAKAAYESALQAKENFNMVLDQHLDTLESS